MKSSEEETSTEEVDLSMDTGPETCSEASDEEMSEEETPYTKVQNGRKRKGGKKDKQDTAPSKQARAIVTAKKQSQAHKNEDQEQTGTEYNPTVLVINAPAQSWTGEIAVLVALSTDRPDLRILTRRGLTRTLIKAMTQDTLDTLLNLNQLQGKPVTFSILETARSTTGIVQRVPAEITTALLRATNPKVRTAERMTVWDPETKTTVETMSVKIVYEGTLPSSIPIGFLGTFSVRPYTPDPIRCYKCQRYGHMSRMCHQRHSTCGICSGRHQTSVCVQRRKAETVVTKCFNCKGNHVTASKACPVRRAKAQALQKASQPKQAPKQTPQPVVKDFTPTMEDFPAAELAANRKSTPVKKVLTTKTSAIQAPATTAPVKQVSSTPVPDTSNTNAATTQQTSYATKLKKPTDAPPQAHQTVERTEAPTTVEPEQPTEEYQVIIGMLVNQLQVLQPLIGSTHKGTRDITRHMIESIQGLLGKLMSMV